ncbi:hypothetical protein DRQ00_06020 [candidate division KSB1 bacterium]|nr:MAG: hypothetical protein DRQ00_06020 [candidate division KSB1 bacterium]RKY86228.1 MAG: hypothetical protein DRQ11_08745 [candidate division KSB1 bacterium]
MKHSQMAAVIGATIFFVLVGFFVGIFWLGQYRYSQTGYLVEIIFDDISGLHRDDPVQMRGVQIGKVEKIILQNNYVRVEIRIDKGYHLPKDSKASIQNIGLLGEKAVNMFPGRSQQYLQDGDVIHGQVTPGLENLREIFNQLQSHLQEVLNIENRQKFSKLLSNLEKASSDIEKLLNYHGEDIGGAISGICQTSETSARMLTENRSTINEILQKLKTTSTRLDSVSNQFCEISTTLKQVADKIHSGQGTMGKLVNDPALYYEMQAVVAKIDSLAEDVKRNPRKYLKISLF